MALRYFAGGVEVQRSDAPGVSLEKTFEFHVALAVPNTDLSVLAHLSAGHGAVIRVETRTDDVLVMAEKEALASLRQTLNDGHRRREVDQVARLGQMHIAATVRRSIAVDPF